RAWGWGECRGPGGRRAGCVIVRTAACGEPPLQSTELYHHAPHGLGDSRSPLALSTKRHRQPRSVSQWEAAERVFLILHHSRAFRRYCRLSPSDALFESLLLHLWQVLLTV